MRVYGRNVFNELKKTPDKIKKVYLTNKMDDEIFDFLRENKILYEVMDNSRLDKLVKGVHQGMVMEVNDFEYSLLEELLNFDKLLVLDHLKDPHNFGAIIRTAEALGIKGIIIPKNRSISINETVMKVSAGSLNYVKICLVSNIVNVIEKLKKANYFIYGADMDGVDYFNIDYAPKTVLIIGSEGEGLSALVKNNCDEIVSIPMKGEINSLNASVAAAIIMSKIVR
ncbi:MAG TPA: 23S rRNA (guanosine(2251)-2'-O)-methyltransferase RlmB [Bacilli bacterium]|nr:23S rRNA (guanosine(2251)-2'-O)-methyltransferase RlmB [Bacilli bacterium]